MFKINKDDYLNEANSFREEFKTIPDGLDGRSKRSLSVANDPNGMITTYFEKTEPLRNISPFYTEYPSTTISDYRQMNTNDESKYRREKRSTAWFSMNKPIDMTIVKNRPHMYSVENNVQHTNKETFSLQPSWHQEPTDVAMPRFLVFSQLWHPHPVFPKAPVVNGAHHVISPVGPIIPPPLKEAALQLAVHTGTHSVAYNII